MEKVARWKWHVRGSWNAREDRIPSAVWLGILWVGMIAGFGLDAKSFLGQHPPLLLHAHAAVFTIWMFLLTAQILLVVRNRVDLHRKLGWFLVGWACLMGVMGPVGVYTALMMTVRSQGPFPYPFFAVHAVDIGGFLVLLAIGIAIRKNPAAHKRMMILSTVALADPGFSRAIGYLYPADPKTPLLNFVYIFYGNVLLVALMLGWDLWKGRLIRSHVIASVTLLASMYLAAWMYCWRPWQDLTLEWVKALAR